MKRKKLLIKNRTFKFFYPVLCAGIVVFYFILIFYYGHINVAYDEVGMKMIVSGELDGIPDGHIMYSNYILGFFLSLLYRIFPRIEWYCLFLCFCSMFSMWAFLYRVFQLVKNKNIKVQIISVIFAFLLFHSIFYETFILLRFTYAAAITGIVFIFYYFCTENKTFFDYIISSLLLLMCFSVRFYIFEMLFPFIIIFFVIKIVKKSFYRGDLIFIISAFLLIICLSICERTAYTGEWKAAYEVNRARAALQDFGCAPEYEENQDLYDELGLTYMDYYVLRMTYWGLSDYLNVDILEKLEQNLIDSGNSLANKDIYSILHFLISHKNDISKYIILLEALLFTWCILITVRFRLNLELGETAGIVLGWIAEILYLAYNGNLPYRVLYSVHITLIICLAVILIIIFKNNKDIISNEIVKEKSEKIHLVASIVCIFIFLILCYKGVKLYQSGVQIYNDNKSFFELEYYLESNSDQTYICFVNEYYNELDIINPVRNNYTKLTGWIGEIPSWQRFLKGEYSTRSEALAMRNDLHFVTYAGDDSVLFLVDYEAEKGYEVNYEYEEVSFDGIDYWIWSLAE